MRHSGLPKGRNHGFVRRSDCAVSGPSPLHRTAMKRFAPVLALSILLVACSDSGIPLEDIRVSGTVTANGVPAAAGRASLIDGFGVTVNSTDISGGEYVLEAEITPDSCVPTAVAIVARDAANALVGIDTQELPGCGTHVANFTF